MRSSNKRSRSKSNRPKTLGNIVNRVFDSSGPEGKVRGTPQQIIDKYMLLARDAQLGGDRVAAENFLQHAEHYTRMLSEAQRELAREAEARRDQQQQGGGQNRRSEQRDDADQTNAAETSGEGDGSDRRRDGRGEAQGNRRSARRDDRRNPREARNEATTDPREASSQAAGAENDTMLVETPESRHQQRNEAETSTPASGETAAASSQQPEGPAAPAAEPAPKPRKPRAPAAKRSPRKPRSESSATEGGAPAPDDAPRAAE